MVGISTAMASPGPGLLSDSTPTSTPTPTVVARAAAPWSIEGTIQAMNGQFWTVQGFVIRVTEDTRIDSTAPLTIGSQIHASGVVQPDGTWLTTHVWTDRDHQPAPPASTQTPTPTATGVAPATQTAAPTATPTFTTTPTPTVTVTPTGTRADADDIRTSDADEAEDADVAPPGHEVARGNRHHHPHGKARGHEPPSKDQENAA